MTTQDRSTDKKSAGQMSLARRNLLLAGAAAGAAGVTGFPAILRAQTREIVVGGAASHAPWVHDTVIPLVERKHDVKVTFEGTRSFVNLEKMSSNKDNQYMSVVQMDDPVMILAVEADLLEKMTPTDIPNLSALKPAAVHQSGYWANYLQPWQGIAYSTEAKPDGVASWEELWDPANAGRVIIPSLQNTEGLANLFMSAHLETGLPMSEAMYEIDAAFERLARLKDNLLTIYTQMPQAFSLLEQSEAWLIGSAFSNFALVRKKEGAPIDLAAPKEGIFASPSGVALVKNGPNPELARAYINELLSAEVQAQLAGPTFSIPTHKDVPLPEGIPDVEIFATDWAYVAENRESWVERWDRVMAS